MPSFLESNLSINTSVTRHMQCSACCVGSVCEKLHSNLRHEWCLWLKGALRCVHQKEVTLSEKGSVLFHSSTVCYVMTIQRGSFGEGWKIATTKKRKLNADCKKCILASLPACSWPSVCKKYLAVVLEGTLLLMDFTYSLLLCISKRTGRTAAGRQWAYFIIVMNIKCNFTSYYFHRGEIQILEWDRTQYVNLKNRSSTRGQM